jgi:uncharacterized membrane protein YgcG
MNEGHRARSRRLLPLLGALGVLAAPGVLAASLLLLAPTIATTTLAAGPPFPSPVAGQYVYDEAGVLSAATEAEAQATIQAIRERSGAEIVVYTQVKPGIPTGSSEEGQSIAHDDAVALGQQWGVGRQGFDDGLVILYDLDESKCHGQVRLEPGSGFSATYMSAADAEHVVNDQMIPFLRECDMDTALIAALQEIDGYVTPQRASELETARQVNAVLGLIVAPVVLVLLAGFALLRWYRFGRDPRYTDDPSVLMAGPPEALTPATAALVYDDRSSRHTLTTAMMDLASRGELAFAPEEGGGHKMGIRILRPNDADPDVAKARRRPLSEAETYALTELQDLSGSYIDPEDLLKFGKKTDDFDRHLEDHAVEQGWFRQRPRSVIGRWAALGAVELGLGVVVGVIAWNLPASGLLLLGAALGLAGVITLGLSGYQPARTLDGARVYAMLAAYRRTLQNTMALARSMPQVVAEAKLPWLETPDQATVWGVALGLQDDVQRVLERSLEDDRAGQRSGYPTWYPLWYNAGWASASSASGLRGGTGLLAAGSFSSSPLPDFGGMMASLGTIGNSPSSSGGGGGGFSGGGGFGGGGGAGGGF